MRAAFALLFITVLSLSSVAQTGAPPPATWKGTNYYASVTVTPDNGLGYLPVPNVFSPLEGFFREELIWQEVERLAASGLDSIRLIPSFWAWNIDRVAYMSSLKLLSEACAANGIRITYMLWSAIGVTSACLSADGIVSVEPWHELIGTNPTANTCPPLYYGIGCRSSGLIQGALALGLMPPGETVFTSVFVEPGNELISASGNYLTWPYGLATRINAYLDSIATFFTSDPDGIAAFGSYDLFNEPNGGTALFNTPIANYIQFIRSTYDRLRWIHPGAHYTIGWAGADASIDALDLAARAAGVFSTYYSVHSYAGMGAFEVDVAARKAHAASFGIDLVVSEFYRTDVSAGQLPWQLKALSDLQVGGQMWGFFQSNVFPPLPTGGSSPIDGVFHAVPLSSGLIDFQPINVLDAPAVSAWTSGTLVLPPFTRTRLVNPLSPTVQSQSIQPNVAYDVVIESPLAGLSVVFFLSTLPTTGPICTTLGTGSACPILYGAGPVYVGPYFTSFSFGLMPGTGSLTPFSGTVFSPSLSGFRFSIQTLVGIPPYPNYDQNQSHLTVPVIYQVL